MRLATSPYDPKAALLEATIAHVHQRLESPQAEDVERFVRAYYAHVSPEDLRQRSDRNLYGAALAHWNIVMVCPPLTITREELDEGLAILDDALAIADEYVV